MAVWTDKFISVNGYARSGQKLTAVRKIVMHYTANPGATALNHYNYFNTLKDRYASAHFFVDKLEALCIIPLNEISYHANDVQKRNADGSAWRGVKELLPNANFLSIGIEMCIEKDGSFHADTLKRAEDVAVELCKKFGLDPATDIVRHRDITYKNCPAPWVASTAGFEAFKKNVNAKLHPVVVAPPVAQMYRVRKTWADASSQIGAFSVLESAKDLADQHKGEGFEVYDKDGKAVYTPVVPAPVAPKPVAPVAPKPVVKPAPVKPKVVMPSGVYNQGDKGSAVKQIQDALNKLNFNCGTPDGDWGAKTTDAIKRFQKVYLPYDVDGVYGAKSKAKMEELLNK
jgi:N-acetylmuramoyl-L-alanine amidase